MTQFVLSPHVGALPIRFSLSPAAVEQILGPPEVVRTNGMGERDEHRGCIGVRYSVADQKVTEIGFSPGVALSYKGRDLFTHDDLIRWLSQFDTPYLHVGFVVFLNLGMTVTGVHDRDEAQRAITVFRKGRWDDVLGKLKPLHVESFGES